MNTQIEKQIQELVKSNLPAQVGEALQTALGEGKEAQKAWAEAQRRIESLNNTIKDRDNKLKKLEALKLEAEEISNQRIILEEDKRNLRIKQLEHELSCEKAMTTTIKEVTMGLVRNTVYRKNIFDSINEPTLDSNGYPINVNKTQSLNETKEEE